MHEDEPATAKVRGPRTEHLFLALIVGAVAVALAAYYFFTPRSVSDSATALTLIPPETASPVGDWSLVPLDGGPALPLSSFKGKVVFLNLWATWCPPCVRELPSIQSLYSQTSGAEEVAIMAVSVDDSPDLVRQFLQKNQFSFPVYTAFGDPPPSLQERGIPFSVILDKEQRIRFRYLGSRDWSSADVVALLGALRSEPHSSAVAPPRPAPARR